MAPYRIGIDTGGAFTDLIRFDIETGEVQTLKAPSSPAKPLIRRYVGSLQSGLETLASTSTGC